MARILQDRYVLLESLGSGGMGEVFLALDKAEHGRRVAISNIDVDLEVWVMENFLPPAKSAK